MIKNKSSISFPIFNCLADKKTDHFTIAKKFKECTILCGQRQDVVYKLNGEMGTMKKINLFFEFLVNFE